MLEGFWKTRESTKDQRPQKVPASKEVHRRLLEIIPDKLGVCPQQTTVLKENWLVEVSSCQGGHCFLAHPSHPCQLVGEGEGHPPKS